MSVYEELADRFEDDELPVLTYFESTWIGNVICRRERHSPPHFPLKMWNRIWLEALTENTHAHISRGDMKQPSAKEASRNTRITNIVQSYISSDPDKILRGIAVNYM